MRSAALVLAIAVTLHAMPCRAQSEEALAGARQLFGEAVGDQGARRYETALEKFRRVAAVRETANVRYRIASCLDALGRLAEALASYDAAVRMGAQDPSATEAVQAARARAAQLDPIVARLAIVVPADAPPGTEIRVDDAPVDATALGTALPLDAGHHTLRATAPGHSPFETAVLLPAGGRVSITVSLAPLPPGPPPTPVPEEPVAPSRPTPAGAWVAFGVGGALAAGSVVAFVLRASNMTTLERDCTMPTSGGLLCPNASRAEVQSAHDAARVEGPLGIGLAAGAVAALGIGAWILLAAPSGEPQAVVVAPTLTATGGGLVVRLSLGP